MVLPERSAPPTEVDVELHEDPMDRLVQWIESQQLERRFDCRFPAPHLPLVRQKLFEPSERKLAKPLAAAQQPLLERRLVERDPRKQIAAVQRRRLFQRLR